MAQSISEASWKAFVKKQRLAVELDDKDLLKALARFDKASESKPEPRIEALKDLAKEIPKQVTALLKLKKALGDKPFGLVKDELYAILEEAEALQKKTQAAQDAAEAADDEEDEDSAPSALVNPKLLFKQLSMCRKDPERTMKFAFVDAKGKEQPAMMALHPRMSGRSLFGKLQAAAGVKTGAYGSAWVDGTSLMLQLDKPLSGLVKKVRAPVKASGFKIAKAVLWNVDGTVFEQDELPDEGDGEAAAQAAPGAPVEGGNGAPATPPQPAVTYEAKLGALLPRVKKAADDGAPEAPKHQKLMEFAAAKATGKDFLSAVAALRQVEQLLDKPTASPGAGTGGAAPQRGSGAGLAQSTPKLAGNAATATEAAPGAAPGRDRSGAKVRFTQARLDWDSARKTVQIELQALEAQIIEVCGDEPDFDGIRAGTKNLYTMLDTLDERLMDKLDDAMAADSAEQRKALHLEALELVGSYRAFVNTDTLLRDIDDNGFIELEVASTLNSTLAAMAAQLDTSLSLY